MTSYNAQRILAVVRCISHGSVATYGQIARLAGLPRHARQVGSVLNSLSDDADVPWHRVVNSQGRISNRGSETTEGLQRFLLEEEGVEFDDRDRIPLKRFQWSPE